MVNSHGCAFMPLPWLVLAGCKAALCSSPEGAESWKLLLMPRPAAGKSFLPHRGIWLVRLHTYCQVRFSGGPGLHAK